MTQYTDLYDHTKKINCGSANCSLLTVYHSLLAPDEFNVILRTTTDEINVIPTYYCQLYFHITSCHVMSRHITSCHVMSRHVTSRHVTSCHVMSRHVTSCHVMSRHVTLCHVVSRHVTSCHVETRGTVTRQTLCCQPNFSTRN